MGTTSIRFHLNDRPVALEDVPPTLTLLRYLRERHGLPGTKEGCAEGDCGACSVAVLELREGKGPAFRAVNACLLFLPLLQGRRVYTVEALATAGELHPAQAAVVDRRASQCGFCTPGIVMSLFEACYRDDMQAPWQVDDQLCGNLCRCTGYRPIRAAARAVAGLKPDDRFRAAAAAYRPGEPGLDYTFDGRRALQPTSLADLLAARAAHPEALLVAGATDLGLRVTKGHEVLPTLISVGAVPELRGIVAGDGWEVGAAVTLTQLMERVGPALPALDKMLRVFGSRQIRSLATVGGNLCTASPIGDLGPVLVALGATARLAGPDGERTLPVQAFLAGYRKTALQPGEVLRSVHIPRPSPTAFCASYKVSKRRELDISTVAAGMYVDVRDGHVATIRLAYGGVSARPAARATDAEAALRGGPWTRDAVEAALPHLAAFQPLDDLRGSARYRSLLVRNLLRGFWLESQRPDRDVLPDAPVGTVTVEVLP